MNLRVGGWVLSEVWGTGEAQRVVGWEQGWREVPMLCGFGRITQAGG